MTFPVFIKAGASRISIAKEIREVNRLRLQFEKQMARKMETLFRTAGRRAAAAYESGANVDNANAQLQQEVGAVFRATYSAVIEKFGSRVFENRKAQSVFEALVFQYYAKEGASKVVGVTQTTKNKIRRAIEVADKEALGVAPTAKLIREYTSGAMGRARAATIARTETHAAASFATDAATRELNLPSQKKRWVSVSDARTRSGHAAANGQEVGIDEPFLVPFNGQTIKMKYPHDGSGGAGNNINCRCLAVYFTDEDDLFDDFEEATEVPPEPIPEPSVSFPSYSVGKRLKLPVINGIRNEDFPVVSFDESLKVLNDDLDFANKQKTQARSSYYNGRSEKEFGKIVNSDDLSKEALAAVAIVNKELNYFADLFGLPRVRGYKVHSRNSIADMGDAVMGLNAKYFNQYADDIAKANDPANLAKAAASRETIKRLEESLENIKNKIDDAKRNDRPWDNLDREYDRTSALLWQEKRDLERYLPPQTSDWDPTSLKTKPFTSEAYMTGGMDHVRSTMYHEFGHQIHQTYKRKPFSDGEISARRRPFEEQLESRWRKVYFRKAKRSREFWTRYAEVNSKEWFAENFSFWAMGDLEKVNPLFIEMIEEIIDDGRS